MSGDAPSKPLVAIACGGTGGHLFPGIAVADQLARRGCEVALLISPKEVDQQAVKNVTGMQIITLPAVGLSRGGTLVFLRGFAASYRAAKSHFAPRPPSAALAMGGFTSAPPILAARRFGAQTFLHESNTIPGRANRWLAWVVDHGFVGFPEGAARLRVRNVTVTGTPVRPQFHERPAADCRPALGLDPARPVCLVMGGSQGASGINDLIVQSLPIVAKRVPALQWLHLTGPADAEKVRKAYAEQQSTAVVHASLVEMGLALGAATFAVSRAGASSIAELAAMRVPAILIPYPAATDNHQWHNARALSDTGAARLLEQRMATRDSLSHLIFELAESAAIRDSIRAALAPWHRPLAAEQIAETMLKAIERQKVRAVPTGWHEPARDNNERNELQARHAR